MMTNRQRMDLLASYGATGSEIEELLAYDRNAFDEHRTDAPPVLPLPAESHVAAWERYALEATAAFTVLRRYSQDKNLKLHVVAQQLIETRSLPR